MLLFIAELLIPNAFFFLMPIAYSLMPNTHCLIPIPPMPNDLMTNYPIANYLIAQRPIFQLSDDQLANTQFLYYPMRIISYLCGLLRIQANDFSK
jgi:hypothetical protein